MAVSLEKFRSSLREIGGIEELPKPRRHFMVKLLGRDAVNRANYDVFDAIRIDDQRVERYGMVFIKSETLMLGRVYTPRDRRDDVWESLTRMGIEEIDTYTQTSDDDMQWTQLSLDGDKSFRSYAATRCLLDAAPEEGGVVETGDRELSLAIDGQDISESL